jgi:hypothetical protein
MLGFVWGLFVTWTTLYILSRIHWSAEHSHLSRCSDVEHCGSPASMLSQMLFVFLLPAVGFAALNAIACRRWSRRKWGIALGVGTLIAVLFYLAPYVIPPLGPIA